MKKQILNLFQAYFIESGQREQDAKQNLSDLKRMNESRLFKMAKQFGILQDLSHPL